MPTPPIARAQAEATIAAIHAALEAGFPPPGVMAKSGTRGALVEAARRLGLAESSIASRLRAIAKTHPDLQPDFTRYKAPAVALAEAVETQRASLQQAAMRGRLADALKEIARLEDRLKALEWAANASAAPAQWTLSARAKAAREHMPYLFTSDFQIGEVIRPQETDNAHGYDTSIFRRRYRRLIETTIRLCAEHTGASWRFPGIIYARGGDTISGAIHDELAATDDVTPIEACEVAFEEEAAGIRHLVEAFGRVEIKDAGGGNHDRTTMKPQSKRANALSYDRLVSYMLRREFRADPRVTFQATESPDVFFPIYDLNVLLTHGDKIGSRGGMGFIGPIATIARGAQKVIMEQQALGRRVDRVDMGHFHTPAFLEWLVCNGCLPGYSEYAKMNRLRPSPPSQFLIFHHPRHGAVDYKLIKLEEAQKAPPAPLLSRAESERRLIKPKTASTEMKGASTVRTSAQNPLSGKAR